MGAVARFHVIVAKIKYNNEVMSRIVFKADQWLPRGKEQGGWRKQKGVSAKVQALGFLSPLHLTPNGNQPCSIGAVFKTKTKLNFEITLDWQKGYKDSTDGSFIPLT